jgi:hypothetical protein
METLQAVWVWVWAVQTNDLITRFVLGNIILLGLIWKGFIEWKKYKASLTPSTVDDEAVARLEQVGGDMFRIVIPEKQQKEE